MRILGVPIPVKYIHLTLVDWLRFALLKPSPKHVDAKFNFVYFSYRPDFEYLKLSIESLVESIASEYISSVHLFEDQKAPFDETEIQMLKGICPSLVMQKVENFSWASPESTLAEIDCFEKVAKDSNDNDMLVKVDSDILFFKSSKLIRILKSKFENVGDGHNEHYRFAQGGLYLIRSRLVKNILSKVTMVDVEEAVKRNRSVGEDKTISTILKKNGRPFVLTRLMLYPSEYSLMKKLTSFNKWDFCSAHFVKDKDKMEGYQKLFS